MGLIQKGDGQPVDKEHGAAPRSGESDDRPVPPRGSRWARFIQSASRYGTRPWVIATDMLSIVSAILAFGLGWVPAVATAAGFVFLAGTGGFYRSRLDPSILNDLVALVGRLLIAATITYSLSDNGTGTIAALGDNLGRAWWRSIVVAAVALIVSRTLMYGIVRSARRRGWVNHRTLIVGAGSVGSMLAENLLAHPENGLRPVAFHDPFPPDGSHRSVPVHATTLDQSIERSRASAVVFAPVATPDSELIDLIKSRHRDTVEFFFVPRLHQVNSGAGREVERVRSIPLIRLRRAAHRSIMWTVKAILDRLLAALLLLLLSPVLLVLAAAVAIFVGRPILFSQQRVGLDGQHFSILKFRSLPNVDSAQSDTAWAAETSRRPTRVGRLLREWSLDELPQLWNILRGDMSFVGPRPERPHFVGHFSDTYTHYESRHRVRSGLTGLAQVNGLRGDTSISERAEYDNVYVETWSLGEDVKIMIRTIGSIVKRSGQ